MVDLETWGTTPGCDIRSIGAVVFDPIAGTLGEEFYVNVSGGEHYDLVRDPSTVAWWAQQSDEAQSALLSNVKPLVTGVVDFHLWWNIQSAGQSDYVRFWAHGPHFDEQILAAVFRAVGACSIPWNYRAPRDLRTMLEAVNMDPKTGIPDFGTAHNALDDAKAQALGVIEGVPSVGNPSGASMTEHHVIGHGSTLNPSAPTARMAAIIGADFVPKPPPRKPILLALTAPAMGSGKTTIAEHLVASHGFVALKFASALKAMARTLLQQMGDDTRTIERRIEGDLKEEIIPALKVTARQLMQRIGTELGRNHLHENVWADVTRDRAAQLLRNGHSVVIDDLRYLNELEAVRWAGGTAVRVMRPGAAVTSSHSSEGELDAITLPLIQNDGSIAELHRRVDSYLQSLNS
jgi:hypothetical protein